MKKLFSVKIILDGREYKGLSEPKQYLPTDDVEHLATEFRETISKCENMQFELEDGSIMILMPEALKNSSFIVKEERI